MESTSVDFPIHPDVRGAGELPTPHEVESLSLHLYAIAGYDVDAVQGLIAHTDPDMTRSYQRGHGRKVLRVETMLPSGIGTDDPAISEEREDYVVTRAAV